MLNYNILIKQEWPYFVAKNIDLWVVSQWISVEDSLINIREATGLYLEDEKLNKINQDYSQYFLTTISV